MGCTLSQPASTPVIVTTRAWATYSGNNTRTVKLDVQAIDVRNGEVVNERLGQTVSSRNNEIQDQNYDATGAQSGDLSDRRRSTDLPVRAVRR